MKNTSNVSRLKSDLVLGDLLLLIGIYGVFPFHGIYFNLSLHSRLLGHWETGVTHRVQM
jgi:hypothetical protein